MGKSLLADEGAAITPRQGGEEVEEDVLVIAIYIKTMIESEDRTYLRQRSAFFFRERLRIVFRAGRLRFRVLGLICKFYPAKCCNMLGERPVLECHSSGRGVG